MILALGCPLLLGLCAARALGLRLRDDPLAFPAQVWLLGCLLLGVAAQGLVVLGVAPSWWWVGPLAVALVALGCGRRRDPPRPAVRVGWPMALVTLAGVVFAGISAAAAMARPCLEGDEGNIWSLKAKSLLVDWPDRFAAAQVHNLHPDYPQLNPLLQAFTYAATGVPEFDLFANRWPVQIADLLLFVAVAAALRSRLPFLAAAPLALLVLGEPVFHELCRTAYADGMVALGLVVALDGWLRWRSEGDPRGLRLAGVGLAFALWSKNETMLYLGCLLVAALVAWPFRSPTSPPPDRRAWRWLAPAAAVVGGTSLWNRWFGMKSDLFGANPTGKSLFTLLVEQAGERTGPMLLEAGAAVTSLQHAHVGFAALAVVAVVRLRHWLGTPLALPTLAVLGAWVGLHVVYVGSFLPLRFHLDTSYLRVTFQLLPAALVLLGAQLAAVAAGRGSGHTAPRP